MRPPPVWNPVRSALFQLPPEAAHAAALAALGHAPRLAPRPDPRLAVSLWGLTFASPLGMAAGFDKNAEVPDGLLSLGFGFAEVGTVTPRPQTGNPRPRVFRLPDDRAMINRLGFNNQGHDAVAERLRRRLSAKRTSGIVGVNIGANKDTSDRVLDYVTGLTRFTPLADYIAVNISSPNTPGLRDLQAPEALKALLDRLAERRRTLVADGTGWRPIVVKLAPDLTDEDVPAIVETIVNAGMDGIAIANTTLRRDGLRHTDVAKESGGLSGAPLFERSTRMLARVYQLTAGAIPLFGVGGVRSGADAIIKLEAGATLIQLYTGLIYEGPGLAARINATLSHHLASTGTSLASMRGANARRWAT